MSVDNSLLANIIKPVFSEKSFALAQLQQYVFEVKPEANKIQLKKAFELAFPGHPVSAVKVIKVASRTKRFGKRTITLSPKRKAIFTVVGDPLPMFSVGAVDYAG
jgi:large subunit ribosomal protein L23